MALTVSSSDPVELLHRDVLRWIHARGWRTLRPAQLEAIKPVLDGTADVIISAPTAGGKTEAAFLPIASRLVHERDRGQLRSGVHVLCVSPLKALINDQHQRLEALCEHLEIPVHRWHGDVPASAKKRLRQSPSGIVLITPESVEALLLSLGAGAEQFLGGLRYLVVDELHSFIGTERGAQLQSLMHRAERSIGRRVPRIALSATLAEPLIAREFLRPSNGETVHYICPPSTLHHHVRVFGHQRMDPAQAVEDQEPSDLVAVSEQLFTRFRGRHHLVFANARSDVELFADRLATLCHERRVPQEFFPHHGNLSKEEREFVEQRLKTPATPTTAVCTSTLEMGIDIGAVHAVGQIGPPPGVAGLRQRMGRSGRDGGVPTLEVHVAEDALTAQTNPIDELRTGLVQTVAMIELMNDGWLEPPDLGDLHLSTLIQQVLSVVAQHGGASARALHTTLCVEGPFQRITPDIFTALLRAMGSADLLVQGADGLLLPGGLGDRIVNHYSFYTAFHTAQEFRVAARARTLGTLPMDRPLRPGGLLIFAGRRWRILDINFRQKVVQVEPSSGGRPPRFRGGGPMVADEVRRRMRAIYLGDHQPSWLDDQAAALLEQGRYAFHRFALADTPYIDRGSETLVLPWRGDKIMNTLAVLFSLHGLEVAQDGVALTVAGASAKSLRQLLADLAGGPIADPYELALAVPAKAADKYDPYLSDDLLTRAYAARALDVPNAWSALRDISQLQGPASDLGDLNAPEAELAAGPVRIGSTPLVVLDLETTGLNPEHDRIVEIAIVKLSPQAVIESRWDTLVNPLRSPGPTEIHGLTATDLAEAPTFADIADQIIEHLAGAVVVAHNAEFDIEFLRAELRRLGADPPAWPILCTLRCSYQLGRAGSRRLADLCANEGLRHTNAHSALGDADATARLLSVYLRRARAAAMEFNDLGIEGPIEVAEGPTSAAPPPRMSKRRAEPAPGTPLSRAPSSGDPRVDSYLELLDRVVADQAVRDDEVAQLHRMALTHAFSPELLHQVHTRYMNDLRQNSSLGERADQIEHALRTVQTLPRSTRVANR